MNNQAILEKKISDQKKALVGLNRKIAVLKGMQKEKDRIIEELKETLKDMERQIFMLSDIIENRGE